MYDTLSLISGKPVLWYPDRKYFLLGNYTKSSLFLHYFGMGLLSPALSSRGGEGDAADANGAIANCKWYYLAASNR
jgi:hypothetical protein